MRQQSFQSNPTWLVDRPCAPGDQFWHDAPCRIGVDLIYDSPSGWLYCFEHAKIVGTVS